MTSNWDELTQQALVGTQMESVGTRGAMPVLVPGESAPARLLQSAGVEQLMRRAAFTPQKLSAPLMPPAPDDDAPAVGKVAANLLEVALAHRKVADPLLHEFFALAAHHQQRLPDHLLPALLQRYTRKRPPGDFQSCLGAHGHWLIQQNPAWGKVLREPETSPREKPVKKGAPSVPAAVEAMLKLPTDGRVALAIEMLATHALHSGEPPTLLEVLQSVAGPWGSELSGAFIIALEISIAQREQYHHQELCRIAATRIGRPQILPALNLRIEGNKPGDWEDMLGEHFFDILRLRKRMHESFIPVVRPNHAAT